MAGLGSYIELINSQFHVTAIEVFAKILTANDDSSKHGALIPTEAYSFFPELPIPDPSENATALIYGVDAISQRVKKLGWKYYQRYPERRITRLNTLLNNREHGKRLLIIVRARDASGNIVYITDVKIEGRDEDFARSLALFFGDEVPAVPGAFVRLPVDAPAFAKDAVLSELLQLYDGVHARGWIDTLRTGDTGIGYTFETLLGIQENNDQNADFNGIELKCKLVRDLRPTSGKINLFQMGPKWSRKLKGIDRLRLLGQMDESGLHSCYSQVTSVPNNLGLWLNSRPTPGDISLYKHAEDFGCWTHQKLEARLKQKHSRAVFVKADSRQRNGRTQYHYNQLIYCERPEIDQFIEMVDARRIVFEFAMTERPPGSVRNHGYPWRLVDERQLDQLFSLQVKLRG